MVSPVMPAGTRRAGVAAYRRGAVHPHPRDDAVRILGVEAQADHFADLDAVELHGAPLDGPETASWKTTSWTSNWRSASLLPSQSVNSNAAPTTDGEEADQHVMGAGFHVSFSPLLGHGLRGGHRGGGGTAARAVEVFADPGVVGGGDSSRAGIDQHLLLRQHGDAVGDGVDGVEVVGDDEHREPGARRAGSG